MTKENTDQVTEIFNRIKKFEIENEQMLHKIEEHSDSLVKQAYIDTSNAKKDQIAKTKDELSNKINKILDELKVYEADKTKEISMKVAKFKKKILLKEQKAYEYLLNRIEN